MEEIFLLANVRLRFLFDSGIVDRLKGWQLSNVFLSRVSLPYTPRDPAFSLIGQM